LTSRIVSIVGLIKEEYKFQNSKESLKNWKIKSKVWDQEIKLNKKM